MYLSAYYSILIVNGSVSSLKQMYQINNQQSVLIFLTISTSPSSCFPSHSSGTNQQFSSVIGVLTEQLSQTIASFEVFPTQDYILLEGCFQQHCQTYILLFQFSSILLDFNSYFGLIFTFTRFLPWQSVIKELGKLEYNFFDLYSESSWYTNQILSQLSWIVLFILDDKCPCQFSIFFNFKVILDLNSYENSIEGFLFIVLQLNIGYSGAQIKLQNLLKGFKDFFMGLSISKQLIYYAQYANIKMRCLYQPAINDEKRQSYLQLINHKQQIDNIY